VSLNTYLVQDLFAIAIAFLCSILLNQLEIFTSATILVGCFSSLGLEQRQTCSKNPIWRIEAIHSPMMTICANWVKAINSDRQSDVGKSGLDDTDASSRGIAAPDAIPKCGANGDNKV
jgi:hypothetical protein